MTIMKNMEEHFSSMVGGAILVVVAVTPQKLIEVVILALVGGAIGAFAKGFGQSAWKLIHARWIAAKLNRIERRQKKMQEAIDELKD